MKKTLRRVLVILLVAVSLMDIPMSALALTIGTVNVDNARLRSSSKGGSIITLLRKGSKVAYAGSVSGQMVKVTTRSKKTGWVYKNYISKSGSTSKKSGKSGIYTVSSTPYYKNKNGKPVKVGTLKKGVKLNVLAVKGKWCKVRTSKGNTYYVKKDNLKKY